MQLALNIRKIPSEPPLYMNFTAGRSDRLVVSFAGVGMNRNKVPPVEFPRVAHWNGENHVLYVSDKSRSWMNGAGLVTQVQEAIEDIRSELKVDSIVAIGNSMGGYAAMVLAAEIDVEAVVAITPQFSVHPEVMPEEWRWRLFRDKITSWPYPQVPDLRNRRTTVTLLHGGAPSELMHARRFPQDPRYLHYIFPRHGHNLARELHAQEQLAPIVTLSMLGRTYRARRAVRAAGGVPRAHFEHLQDRGFALSKEALK